MRRGRSADGGAWPHGSRPRPASQTQAAKPGAANRRPSTRSSRPPWPGIRWPLSLTPAAASAPDSNRSPAWRDDAPAAPATGAATRSQLRAGRAASDAADQAAPRPSRRRRPAQVLPGLIRGASRGPPMRAPDEIGADVGRPDHQQQPQHVGAPAARVAAQPDQRQGGQADIERRRRPRDRDGRCRGMQHRRCPAARADAAMAASATSRAPATQRQHGDDRRRPATAAITAAVRRRRHRRSRAHSPAMITTATSTSRDEQPAADDEHDEHGRGEHQAGHDPLPQAPDRAAQPAEAPYRRSRR